ncbi:MAG: PfkB family carbohydrate kinase [Oscillospiraceae bacterium]|nr:PfkB family carbohydrate kinase [Oscillospiraceae bacterium]
MTQREQQILRWIEEDPLISQEKLAELAGITRSSVAVHISNLMKKGYIAGKGYVLRSSAYAVVVGGVNIDIGGESFSPLVMRDSNPGRVRTSLGGVGRNIAHNMSLLGMDVRFLTAMGDDAAALTVTSSCGELGIDISHALHIAGATTSTYLFLAGPDGDMQLAVSDMEICSRISPDYLAANLQLLNEASLVVADTNIPEESLAYLATHVRAPLFIDPVSTIKAKKLLPILGSIHTLKPNRLEAALLSGIEITNDSTLRAAAQKLLDAGIQRLFISCGGEGVLACENGTMELVPCCRANMKNATGAGDSMMAAIAWSFSQGLGLLETAKAANAAASIAVEGLETINPALSPDAVRLRVEQNY